MRFLRMFLHRITAVLLLAPALGCPSEERAPPKPAVAQPAAPAVDWSSAFKHRVRFDPARTAVVVDVEVAPGFHAYTVGESTGRPLKLSLDEGLSYAVDGEVQYPKGKTKMLPIGKSVIVEGAAEVVAAVKSTAESPDPKIKGKFRYQVCTNEVCDRPRTKPFELQHP